MNAKELIKEVEKEDEMRQGNVSLILDGYNDLFSDFDPRPTEQRMLSDDFLIECKRAARDKEFGLELRLLVPKTKRNINEEAKIKKRLKNYFYKHHKERKEEIKNMRKEGLIWVVIGFTLTLLSTFMLNYLDKGFVFNLLFVVLEPAGWFTIWNGFDKIFLSPREKESEIEYYKKMASADIYFAGY